MAHELIRAIVKHERARDHCQPIAFPFQPDGVHDLESIIWVMLYSAMMHHYKTLVGGAKKWYKTTMIDRYWGSSNTRALTTQREATIALATAAHEDWLEWSIPDPQERACFRDLVSLVYARYNLKQPFAHADLVKVIDQHLELIPNA